MSCVSGVFGDFPVQLATRLPEWSAGGLRRCSAGSAARLPCLVSFSKVHEQDMNDLLRTSRQHSRSILVRHVRHVRFPRDMLATSSRGRHEDATRMLRENCPRRTACSFKRNGDTAHCRNINSNKHTTFGKVFSD